MEPSISKSSTALITTEIDIRKLSPGTRGIVLLLLYLALDDADDRPLIIDQPEENLDPQSIFDELVGLFIGKGRFIDAPHSGAVVRVASLASRSSSFVGARRVSS